MSTKIIQENFELDQDILFRGLGTEQKTNAVGYILMFAILKDIHT